MAKQQLTLLDCQSGAGSQPNRRKRYDQERGRCSSNGVQPFQETSFSTALSSSSSSYLENSAGRKALAYDKTPSLSTCLM